MTIEEVARRIENPELVSIQDIPELEKLIERHPYAQSFPLLLLAAMGRADWLGMALGWANWLG